MPDVLVTPAPKQTNGHANDATLLETLRGLLGNSVNADQVRAIVADELKKQPATTIEVKVNGAPIVKIPAGQHPVFERVLKYVAAGLNVLLVGPAGCGKTHLCEQIAKALGREYGELSGSAGVSESALTGWLLPADGGKFEYQPSEFVVLYEKGDSVFCTTVETTKATPGASRS